MTVVSLALLLVCAIPAAYLMSQYKFKSANLLFGLFTMGIVVPRLSILIAIFLLVGFMQTIPTAIVESAKIDGCNSFGLLMMSAGVMVAVIPMIVVYSFLQDKIISGMVAGAVKG